MRLFLVAILTILPLHAHARWTIESEFRLQLHEGLFDQVIEEFRDRLHGRQQIEIGNFTVTPGGIPVQVRDVRAEVDYSFRLPKRLDAHSREWELTSETLAARMTIGRISATQTIIREIDGIIVEIPLHAECQNVALVLPAGRSRVSARIRADIVDNRVRLSLPGYAADWDPQSWQVESMHCTGVQGFDEIVKREALAALSSLQNFDSQVRARVEETFAAWSADASLLLLNPLEIPSGSEHVNVLYEPREARDLEGGIELRGTLRFEYPFVAPGQNIVHAHSLGAEERVRTITGPQVLLPFEAIRSLMAAEHMANRPNIRMHSQEIPGFGAFMANRWQQFWGFPELQRYPTNAEFAFDLQPSAPPTFVDERIESESVIAGNLDLPLLVKMHARIDGAFTPMVEFQTHLSGFAKFSLSDEGKITLNLTTNHVPVSYAWNEDYVRSFNPTTRIAADSIAQSLRTTLATEGLSFHLPSVSVGKNLRLSPRGWHLQGPNLRLDFGVEKGLPVRR